MKIARFLTLMFVVLALLTLIARRSTAQSNQAARAASSVDQFNNLLASVAKLKDTNVLDQVLGLITRTHLEQDALVAASNVRALDLLRSGHTNEAIEHLESQLDGALMKIGMDSKYARDFDAIIRRAKEYRAKFPRHTSVPEVDAGVSRAFNSLPK
jgi:hypothetical protein